eukprot:SM000169S02726  [mRNA]  locus=s169:268490:268997:+ [translate_table: standard]
MERSTTVWSRFVGTQPAPGGRFMAASVVESAREEGDRRRARAKHCTDSRSVGRALGSCLLHGRHARWRSHHPLGSPQPQLHCTGAHSLRRHSP